jgi:urease accessory protein UreE
MLCDRVLGRFGGEAGLDPAAAARLDWLDLSWDECHRRALARTTRRGRAVRLVLRLGVTLRHDDVVADAPDCLLVIAVRPTDVLVARPRSAREAAVVALEWGNLHVPVEVTEVAPGATGAEALGAEALGAEVTGAEVTGAVTIELATPVDGPAEAAVYKHGVPFVVARRRFEPMPVSGLTWTLPGSLVRRAGDGRPAVAGVEA